jgi:DNA-directed RNA polymerase specialized sigma subunit
MKIPLNVGQVSGQTSREIQLKSLERDIAAAKKGDWNAKNNLFKTFLPLLNSLAEKRTSDKAELNALVDKGKEGLVRALGHFNDPRHPEHFQIFALDFIEKSMDKKPGFLARLFGRG